MKNTKIKQTIIKYLPQILLTVILLTGAFFRFFRINEYMTFLGDEGRDVLVVKRMLVDHKFTLLGPITSVGSMYMGPIYYYFMAPFLWLWHFDPVGPAIMVGLFSVGTIFVIYRLGSDFFHPAVGLTSSFLYAVSPLMITSGRSSWNPNVVPFFSVVLIYSLFQVITRKKYRWFILTGLALGVLLQLHYVTFLFLPIILVSLAMLRFKIPLVNYFMAVVALIISYSPFLLFELRHEFVNTQAVIRFVIQQNTSSQGSIIVQFFNVVNDVFIRLFWRLITINSAEITKIFIPFLFITLVIYFRNYLKSTADKLSFTLIMIWLITGVVSFGIYRGVIYDYYFGSLFAVPFILTGIMLYTLWRFSAVTKILSVLIFLSLNYFFLQKSPLLPTPNNLLANTKKIAEFVYKVKDDKPYNFALIAGKNSDHAYRYFLELWGPPPVVIENPVTDPTRKTVTNQLLVVCEEKVCQPEGHPLWEIAGFGRAKVIGDWNVVTARVFQLEHYNK
ncbi:glycosyltransferase family 39 protein [Candidatus Gottesmanbacteria bacterium]|nr:glycosyltransferase family 39 protein [Candidatus Gottesmanbacteria bacterium]